MRISHFSSKNSPIFVGISEYSRSSPNVAIYFKNFQKFSENCDKIWAGRQDFRLTPPPLRVSRTRIKDLRSSSQHAFHESSLAREGSVVDRDARFGPAGTESFESLNRQNLGKFLSEFRKLC